MSSIKEIEGNLRGEERRFAVVASRFNSRVVEGLLAGALDCLRRHGVTGIEVVRVPGAWEIPLALEELAQSGDYQALVAVGAVIRGETPHFDHICAQASQGIAEVSRRHRIPVGFGLLTCDTTEQAEARAGGKAGNKGWDAALAALEMADLVATLRARE
jgi:6,7-dimethyl-8-ribityllumazine synthase